MARWTLTVVLAAVLAALIGLGPVAPSGALAQDKSAPAGQPEVKGPLERWAGSILLPGGMKLDFTLHLQRVQDRQTGKLSIPVQGLLKQSLRDVTRDADAIAFTLAEPLPQPAWAKFALTDGADGAASGTMTQSGQTFQVKMERLAEGEPDRSGLKAGAPAPADLPGDRWEGGVELPGVTLGMNIRLVPAKGDVPASGTMSIPMQGLTDGTLHDVVIEPERLRFVLRAAAAEATWAKFDLKVSPDGPTAEGPMEQMGAKYTAKFRKLAAGEAPAGPKRPQEPAPPFPYESRDVTFRNEKAGITLAGTLTTPKGPGPHPAAVMITGSGPQDRDESLLGHKPFLVIADHLSRNGIAVLRVDDRGVGKSEGDFGTATSEDFAEDVRAAIAFLRSRDDVKPGGVGLIGHSEGGLITSKVAGDPAADGGKNAGVAWIVMLAGTGISGLEIMVDQASNMAAPDGTDPKKVKAAAVAAREAAELIIKDAPMDQVRQAVRRLIDAQVDMGGEEAKKAMGDGAGIDSMTDQAITTLASPWFRYFLKYDPREDLSRIRVPVLALNGELDTQVRSEQNLAAIDAALKAGGNTDYKVVELKGLNHLFQTATTGRFDEYAAIEETISPVALEAMTAWIRAKSGLAK